MGLKSSWNPLWFISFERWSDQLSIKDKSAVKKQLNSEFEIRNLNPIFFEWTFFWNKKRKYVLNVKSFEFQVEIDFSNINFVRLLRKTAFGDDMIFCQTEHNVVWWLGTFCEESFNNNRFFQYLWSKWCRDWCKSWLWLLFDVHSLRIW